MTERTFDSAAMESVEGWNDSVTRARIGRVESLADLDRRHAYAYDGYTSASAFLVHRCGMSPAEARREVFLARSWVEMPYAAKSVESHTITFNQFEILAHARQRHPEEFAQDEPTLVESVSARTTDQTRKLVDYWVQAHDEGVGDEEEPPSRVFLSKTWRGRGRLDGDLDPLTHDLLATALDQLMSEIVETTPVEELAPAPQRRAEALAEMARRTLDSPDSPTDHGNRPHVTAIVDYHKLTGHSSDGLCELLDGTVITPALARLLACDATVCRLLLGPDGEILDLGRTQRTVTPAQWRALRARDRHCQWWGCFRPASWCDAHHIRHWIDGGPTDLDNLVLICRYHHTLIHRQGWKLTGKPGDIAIIRPDGTILANAPP